MGKHLGESDAGTEVLPADRDVAMIVYARLADDQDLAQSGISASQLIMPFGPGGPKIITKAKVECEMRRGMPVILHVSTNLIGAKRRHDQVKVAGSAGRIAQEQRGNSITGVGDYS